MKPVFPAHSHSPLGPYSPGFAVGNMMFVSGQIPRDNQGQMRNESIEVATRTVLDNLRHVLVAGGFAPYHVVKTTVFMIDLADFDGMNKTYAEFFVHHRPARSTVQVSKLPAGARVEIECIAVKES